MDSIIARFKEPSSWAGIAVIISMVTGQVLPPELLASGVGAIGDLLSVLAALAAFFMKEKSSTQPK